MNKVISLQEQRYIKMYKEFYKQPRLNLKLDTVYHTRLKVVN